MKKDSIVHFVGYVTTAAKPVFVDQWSQYIKEYKGLQGLMQLQEKTAGTGKYDFISRHVFNERDFNFPFVKGRISENFPDHGAKVNMLGGYVPVESKKNARKEKVTQTIIACMNRDRTDIDEYRLLSGDAVMNIYEPFFENCKFSLIMEFLVSKQQAPLLLEELLKRKDSPEISMFKDCPVLSGSKSSARVLDTVAK